MPKQIKDLTPLELTSGITGYYAHGAAMTLGYIELVAGSSVPMHQHMQEQITYIIQGEMDMMIAGKSCLLSAGMYYVIPADTPHSAIAITDCKVIDAFCPVREDYKR